MYVPSTVVLQDLSDALKLTGPAALPAWWLTVSARAQGWAYGAVARALAQRGYSAVQIAAWDDGPAFERDLTLWKSLVTGGATEDVPKELLKDLDRRKEMCVVQVLNAGVFQYPQFGVGQANAGANQTGNDLVDWEQGEAPRVPGERQPWGSTWRGWE